MPHPRVTRPCDVVLYGASGFVGHQAADYLALRATRMRWAVAGRSAERLQVVLGDLGVPGVGLFVADAADADALDALAASTRVVLNTAGPFSRHGSELLAACVRHGTHYVDITGETPWVREMIVRHHDAAARRGTRIVPGCGFDSVPSDLGAWLVAQALRLCHGERCTEVKACFSMRGGLNGGTVASLLALMDSGHGRDLANPFLLDPPGSVHTDAGAHADPVAPHRDADFDAWVGPFVMGPINTRVVRRTAALATGGPFAPDFRYQEYLRLGRGAVAALAAAGLSVGTLAAQGMLAYRPVRRLAAALAPAPGEGPSRRAMDEGWFRCELVGVGERGTRLRGGIAGRGDPGNRATTTFVCEAALALVQDFDQLPGGPSFGGVLTPALAFGGVLAARLRAAGMTVTPLA